METWLGSCVSVFIYWLGLMNFCGTLNRTCEVGYGTDLYLFLKNYIDHCCLYKALFLRAHLVALF